MMSKNWGGGGERWDAGEPLASVELGGGLREVQVSGNVGTVGLAVIPLTWFWLRVRGVVGVWALL